MSCYLCDVIAALAACAFCGSSYGCAYNKAHMQSNSEFRACRRWATGVRLLSRHPGRHRGLSHSTPLGESPILHVPQLPGGCLVEENSGSWCSARKSSRRRAQSAERRACRHRRRPRLEAFKGVQKLATCGADYNKFWPGAWGHRLEPPGGPCETEPGLFKWVETISRAARATNYINRSFLHAS